MNVTVDNVEWDELFLIFSRKVICHFDHLQTIDVHLLMEQKYPHRPI